MTPFCKLSLVCSEAAMHSNLHVLSLVVHVWAVLLSETMEHKNCTWDLETLGDITSKTFLNCLSNSLSCE